MTGAKQKTKRYAQIDPTAPVMIAMRKENIFDNNKAMFN